MTARGLVPVRCSGGARIATLALALAIPSTARAAATQGATAQAAATQGATAQAAAPQATTPRAATAQVTEPAASATAEPAHTATALVLPSMTPVADCSACPSLHRPDPEAEQRLAALGRELDSVVVGAAQDLGLTIDVTARPTATPSTVSEQWLAQQAGTSWVFSPRLGLEGSAVLLRIVAVQPGSKVLLVRTEQVKPDELEVRAVLMMRDLVHAASSQRAAPAPTPDADEHAVVKPARSPGRAVLALNAAAFGAYVGFALQSAGGSNDPRLTYPLIALGTGVGIGGSILAAEEWDIGVGDAWFLSAGSWWPALGAAFVGKNLEASKRYLYSAAAAAGGLTLATTAVAFGHMSEGDAIVAHSGGAFGLAIGGVTDLAIRGKTDVTPFRGMGTGAIVGVIAAGALARFTPPQAPSKILFVDLGAALGALGGAAVASPLVFGTHVNATRTRLWLTTIAAGTIGGAIVGYLVTPSSSHESRTEGTSRVAPFVGVIAEEQRRDGHTSPVTGMGVQGVW
ncbi:MAG TPA: hypothetical protein VH062_34495 [Polyangiaceae bacterium]|jgi:hypothetical protein|nr:hypothetical protein [Polyangiaceae bacterium]